MHLSSNVTAGGESSRKFSVLTPKQLFSRLMKQLQHNMHPFFLAIKGSPDLVPSCRMDITGLPEPWKPVKEIKAIVLGADPTNDGVPRKRGLIEFAHVFGIGHKNENSFWGSQKR